MSPSPLHLTVFEGGRALSPFRSDALLRQLQRIDERLRAVRARHVHWVASHEPLERAELDRLASLLDYGEAAEPGADGILVVVMPRLGTVSPWASKATDIAHNCGLPIAPRRARHRVAPGAQGRAARRRAPADRRRNATRSRPCCTTA